jgi:hypothetical protein
MLASKYDNALSSHTKDQKLEIEIPFPVILRGKDATGDRFELQTVLDSLSGRDLSLRIARPPAIDSPILACVYLSTAPNYQHTATRVVMRGKVHYCIAVGGDYSRVFITFERHRFVYPCTD